MLSTTEFDFIVVGAGSAGCVLADRLSASGQHSVLLVEARSEDDVRPASLDDTIYLRGQREDYDHWRALGNVGWAYSDVLPYFRKAEDNQIPDSRILALDIQRWRKEVTRTSKSRHT